MAGKKMIEIGKDVLIEPGAIIDANGGRIGDRSIIRSGARIEGTYVELGTESYLDHGAWIGGGSCWDKRAYLRAGCWLHMGWNSHINIARGVDIGDEVGIGVETKIFTHGAYLPIDLGFPIQWGPVKIGDRVWLPNAWINPGITIADNVVVSARSLINRDLPAGCYAGGIPVTIIKENAYPNPVEPDIFGIFDDTFELIFIHDGEIIICGETQFLIPSRIIEGPANEMTEKIKNQLRRNGIRFKYYPKDGEYVPWN
jgi:acetyltransferase-like isoleucine patch superfamily enzyme